MTLKDAVFTKDKGKVFSCFSCGGGSTMGYKLSGFDVIGCNEINFPCKNSDHPIIEIVKVDEYDKEEEEKRVFYVAISRAKDKLYLTYARKPTYFITEDMKKIIFN